MGLLERAAALEELKRWLGHARRGDGRLVLVEGEAGVGKTALLNAFAARHRTVRLLWSGGDPLSTPRPLGPLVDLAGQLGGRVADLVNTPARDQLFPDVLEQLSDQVLVIEDLHWADEATLELLTFLAHRMAGTRALIVASYRGEETSHPLRLMLGDLANVKTVQRLALRPLSLDAVTALAGDSGIDPAHLYAITEGNPFYITEVIAAPGDEIPATVRDAVLARASRSPPPLATSSTRPRS